MGDIAPVALAGDAPVEIVTVESTGPAAAPEGAVSGSQTLPRAPWHAARRVGAMLMAALGLASTQAPHVGHGGYSIRHTNVVCVCVCVCVW